MLTVMLRRYQSKSGSISCVQSQMHRPLTPLLLLLLEGATMKLELHA